MLSFNNKEKDEKLLDWVRSRVDKLEVENFSSSWRSGVLLCALVDSIVPGSCPRYDLLNEENRLGNAQLAVQLLEKLNIKSVSTAFSVKLFLHLPNVPTDTPRILRGPTRLVADNESTVRGFRGNPDLRIRESVSEL